MTMLTLKISSDGTSGLPIPSLPRDSLLASREKPQVSSSSLIATPPAI